MNNFISGRDFASTRKTHHQAVIVPPSNEIKPAWRGFALNYDLSERDNQTVVKWWHPIAATLITLASCLSYNGFW